MRQEVAGAACIALLFGLVAVGGAGCGEAPRPNVLLIVADTARAGALSCYGGSAHTPNLCGLAERGVLFENAYSNSNWTLPASVSLFTGDYPTAYARIGERVSHKHDFYWVNDGVQMLAEALVPHGYESVHFLENTLAEKANTFQGFAKREVDDESIFDRRAAIQEQVGIDLSDPRYHRILRILDYLLNENPRNFFAVQWIMDPHATYNPPDRFPTERTKNRASLPRPLEDYRKLGSKGDPKTGLPPLPEIADVLTETERAYLRELYDRELESVDERVGYILKGLETSGLAESTLIVFTSDHGEGFGEHGRFLHGGGRWLYQEFIRIPLIVSGPGVLRGRRVAGPVSLVDLMPTLCELLRVRCLEDAQGESFRTVLTGEAQALPDSRGAYIVGTTRRGQFDALIRGDFKLILTPDGRELYDLEADPDERRDLSTERPEIVARLTTEILALRVETEARRTRGGEDPEVLARASEETLEQLRALGYVESPN